MKIIMKINMIIFIQSHIKGCQLVMKSINIKIPIRLYNLFRHDVIINQKSKNTTKIDNNILGGHCPIRIYNFDKYKI